MAPFSGQRTAQIRVGSNSTSSQHALLSSEAELAPVLYEANRKRTPWTRRIVTRNILVEMAPGFDRAVLKGLPGVAAVRDLSSAPNYLIVEASSPSDALSLATDLRLRPRVISANPILGQRYSTRFVPDDPFFPREWYLRDDTIVGQPQGINLHVADVWNRYRGQGINIAIVDDGLQLTHPDLAPNCNPAFHFDYRDNDNDPSPMNGDERHGTFMAGLSAARGNNGLGMAGVAFEATLVGVRLIGNEFQTDEMNAQALLHSNVWIHVSNDSWGPVDDGETLDGPGPLTQLGLKQAATSGRSGRGTIFVWPSGNGAEYGDNANYDGFANSIYTIAVGAVDGLGKKASYSEPGACLVISAPGDSRNLANDSQFATTDLTGDAGINFAGSSGDLPDPDYTVNVVGTSVAAAIVSGVVALVLEANPSLGWRDVQEILIRSATKNDPEDADWITNESGFHFNHKYGAGLANAAAAVELATRWVNLGPQKRISLSRTNLALSIPNNNSDGLTLNFDFDRSSTLRVEHVRVTASIKHPHRGDLAITLTSPSGTQSRLAEKHSDPNVDYAEWDFTSVFHWGERSGGVWKVQISDLATPNWGMLDSVGVELLGTAVSEAAGSAVSDVGRLVPIGFVAGGFEITLFGNPEREYEIQFSPNLIDWTALSRTNITGNGSVKIILPESTNPTQRFYRAILQDPAFEKTPSEK